MHRAMSFATLNPNDNQPLMAENDILSVFRPQQERKNEIQKGMSPNEIADIVNEAHKNRLLKMSDDKIDFKAIQVALKDSMTTDDSMMKSETRRC